jgi:membrane protease YdiL (CAAX protease family)
MDLALPRTAPVRFLLLVALYPLVEELAFRGALQSFLSRYSPFIRSAYGISGANLATSLGFVAIHFLYHAPVWSISIFLPSMIFGYFKDRYQTVIPCVLLHSFYNLGFYVIFGIG